MPERGDCAYYFEGSVGGDDDFDDPMATSSGKRTIVQICGSKNTVMLLRMNEAISSASKFHLTALK